MKFTKKLVTVAAALCAAGALFLAGCARESDPYGILDVSVDGKTCNIEFTNDTDVNYARAFKTTKTNHLSSDILVQIDTNGTSELKVGSDLNYTAGYIFNLTGTGAETSPYNFALVGFRYVGTSINYYISYFTNVLDGEENSDISSDNANFVTKDNIAVEYDLSEGVKTLDSKYFVKGNDGVVSVYVHIDATEDTKDAPGNYKIYFGKTKEDAASTDSDKSCLAATMSKDSLNAAPKAHKTHWNTSTSKLETKKNSSIILEEDGEYGDFTVAQARIGYYSMVKQDTTLRCTMTMSDFSKNAVSSDDAIIWNETITNVR